MRIKNSAMLLLTAVLMFGLSSVSGCNRGPATARVTGMVTFGGKPLAEATVEFLPEDGSRSSVGTTDTNGTYELKFSATAIGAVPGKHKVVIRTVTGETDSDNPVLPKEILPARYHKNSELTADLKSGKQTVNFDLEP